MTALRATLELIEMYNIAPHAVKWYWETAVVEVILQHGSNADAKLLLPAFLQNPSAREILVPVFAQHGDLAMAERLYATFVEAGQLRADAPTEVFHAIGVLGYEAAEQFLWGQLDTGSHSNESDACLGLLNLSCRGIRAEIGQALERHWGKNLFPELLPALATKTLDQSWLGRLVEWGEGGASTDCNGGLILGIALHGAQARSEFIRLLWNPEWEAYSESTASNYWAYAGARVLGLSMQELYSDLLVRLKSAPSVKERRHCIRTFAALLGLWACRPYLGLQGAPNPSETCDDLLRLVFQWSTPHEDDSLIGVARQALGRGDEILRDLSQLEAELRIRATHEIAIRTLLSR